MMGGRRAKMTGGQARKNKKMYNNIHILANVHIYIYIYIVDNNYYSITRIRHGGGGRRRRLAVSFGENDPRQGHRTR